MHIEQKRNFSLDIIRVIAVLAVVLTHCSASFVTDYALFTHEFVFGNILDSISRVGVPLFLMISRALFLDENKKITVKGILCKNVKNLAIIVIAWAILYSLMYNVLIPIRNNQPISIASVVIGVLYGHFHMWYLYMIIGMYLITPFLKKIVCRENRYLVLLFIIISFISQFFAPIINILQNEGIKVGIIQVLMDQFHLDFFAGFIIYYLLGWYIVHIGVPQKWIRFIVYVAGLLSLAGMIICVHYTGDYENAYDNIGVFVLLYSASVFLALNNVKLKLPDAIVSIVVKLSKLTFGVYIIHVALITAYGLFFSYVGHPAIYIIQEFLVVTGSSFLISYVISKIPLIKKLIKA